MRRWRAALGLVAGAIIGLSSFAHALLGWPPLESALEDLQASPDLVRSFSIGWYFGGVAILVFGCIAVGVFLSALRDRAVSLLPTMLIALGYVAFGLWALVVSRNPFFLIFIVPGLMLGVASMPPSRR
jgi:hypothetical protein